MCSIRECKLREGGFFLFGIIEWECADGRTSSRIEVAFFFSAVQKEIKGPEVGHAVGAYGLIPNFSLDSPAWNINGKVA